LLPAKVTLQIIYSFSVGTQPCLSFFLPLFPYKKKNERKKRAGTFLQPTPKSGQRFFSFFLHQEKRKGLRFPSRKTLKTGKEMKTR